MPHGVKEDHGHATEQGESQEWQHTACSERRGNGSEHAQDQHL